MALIIYPSSGYDSFVSLVNAETNIDNNVVNTDLWDALTDTKKEIYLRQATLLIKNKIDLDLIDDASNLELATSLLANYGVSVDLTNDTQKGNVKVKEIVGVVKTEYFSKGKKSNSIPDNVTSLLSDYGYSNSNSFKIDRA